MANPIEFHIPPETRPQRDFKTVKLQLNTYAVQFRYEACPVEMIAMEAAQQAVAALLNWSKGFFEE